MAFAERAELITELSLKDNLSRGLGKAVGSVKAFDRATSGLQKNLSNLGKDVGRGLSTGLRNITRLTTVIGGLAGGAGVAALKWAGDFEASLRTINTVAKVNAAQLAAIGSSIRDLAKSTGTPLEELTAAYYDLVSAGVAAKDATSVLTAANRLAIGGLGTTAETVDLLTTALNTYGLKASQVNKVADQFAQAIAAGKVTAADLASSFATIAPLAASAGIELAEVAAGYAQLTSAGVPAAEAATQMRSALVALLQPTTALEKLQKKTGLNFARLAKQKGLVVALETLRKQALKAGVPFQDLFGRIEAFNFALATTGSNFGKYQANLKAVGDSAGEAAKQMSERQQGLNFQLTRLKALAKDAGITIGSALLPKITPLLDKLAKFMSSSGVQAQLSKFGKDLGKAFGDLFSDANLAKGRALFDDIAKGIREFIPTLREGLAFTGEVISKAVSLFRSLPPDLQKVAIAALAVNKLTGGAVGSVIGDLLKIGLSSLKTITAGVVTVIGATVNVPGGALGGGVPTVVGTGAKAAEVGLAAKLLGIGKSIAKGGIVIAAGLIGIDQFGQAIKERNDKFDEAVKVIQAERDQAAVTRSAELERLIAELSKRSPTERLDPNTADLRTVGDRLKEVSDELRRLREDNPRVPPPPSVVPPGFIAALKSGITTGLAPAQRALIEQFRAAAALNRAGIFLRIAAAKQIAAAALQRALAVNLFKQSRPLRKGKLSSEAVRDFAQGKGKLTGTQIVKVAGAETLALAQGGKGNIERNIRILEGVKSRLLKLGDKGDAAKIQRDIEALNTTLKNKKLDVQNNVTNKNTVTVNTDFTIKVDGRKVAVIQNQHTDYSSASTAGRQNLPNF